MHRIVTPLVAISMFMLLVGCASQAQVPDYSIHGQPQEQSYGSISTEQMYVDTKAKSKKDLTAITKAVHESNPDVDAISIAFMGGTKKTGLQEVGGGYYFKNARAASIVLPQAYSISDINRIMKKDHGMLVISISDTINSVEKSECKQWSAKDRKELGPPPKQWHCEQYK